MYQFERDGPPSRQYDQNMKTNIAAALAFSATLFATAGESAESIDALIASGVQGGPVQVEIEAKFIEITQSNLKELSFDWLAAKPAVVQHTVMVSPSPPIPLASILDKPIKLKIEVVPIVPPDMSLGWLE